MSSGGGIFRSQVLDFFHHPRNLGIVEDANRRYLAEGNPWSIRILFTLRVGNGRIQEVKFKAQGCVTSVACCSALTEMVQGKDVDHALSITEENLSEALGRIPAEKMHCCRLAIDALREALQPSTACDYFSKGVSP